MRPIDAVDLSVWWSRLVAFTAEAGTILRRAAFSPVVTESNDFGVALFSPTGELVAQPDIGFAAFTGCLTRSVPKMLATLGDPLEPGDVLVTNDPWIGASQLNDYIFVSPIYHRGDLVAYASNVAHSQDVGGPGLLAANTSTIYAEGLQVPPLRLVRKGRVNEEILTLILQNVRTPETVRGDFFAQVSANDVLGSRVQEFLDAEDQLDYLVLFDEILRRSEAAMRSAVADLPDGRWSAVGLADGLDEEIRIRLELEITGSDVVVDFTGTSDQSSFSFNCTKNFAVGRALAPIVAAVSPSSTYINGGSFRNIEFRIPEGCIFDPRRPAAIGARGQTSGLIAAVILRAFASVAPKAIPAESSSPVWAPVLVTGPADGSVTRMILLNGGTGALPTEDGYSCLGFPESVASVRPETLEEELPLQVLVQEFVPDSGGPGEYRGGLTQRFAFRWEGRDPVRVSLRTEHVRHPPIGLSGGLDGSPGKVLRNGVEIEEPKSVLELRPGEILELQPPGGGGHGNASRRAEWRLSRDVDNGTVRSWPVSVGRAAQSQIPSRGSNGE
jgi:N-methylhydantoinase B